MEIDIIKEHIIHLLFPGLSCIQIHSQTHQQMASGSEVILIRHGMRLQIGPQVDHQIGKQRDHEPILLLRLVHDVQRFGQVLGQDIQCLQAMRQIATGIGQIAIRIQLIKGIGGLVRS
jgi:hypothetical protein